MLFLPLLALAVPPPAFTRAFESYQAYEGKALSALRGLEKEARALSKRFENLKRYLSRQENRRMLTVVLGQQRETIQRVLGLHARAGDSPWKARSKRIAGYALGKIYLVAVLYMGVVTVFSLLGFQEAYQRGEEHPACRSGSEVPVGGWGLGVVLFLASRKL